MSKAAYIQTAVSLSEGQLEKLARAIRGKEPITLRISPGGGSHNLNLTKTQVAKLAKGGDIDVKLSATQLSSMKHVSGGFAFLIPLLTAAATAGASAIAAHAGNKLARAVLGDGMLVPGKKDQLRKKHH